MFIRILWLLALLWGIAAPKSFFKQHEVPPQKIKEYIEQNPDYLFLIYLSSTDESCRICTKANEIFDSLIDNLDGMVKFVFLNCAADYIKQDEQLVNSCKNQKSLPQLLIQKQFDRMNPNTAKPEKVPFYDTFELQTLTNFVNKHMLDYVKPLLRKKDYKKFNNNQFRPIKCYYISQTEEPSMQIKALASHFYSNVSFAFIDADNELAQKFYAKSQPTLVLRYTDPNSDKVEDKYYVGNFGYYSIRKWMEIFIGKYQVQFQEKQVKQNFALKKIQFSEIQESIQGDEQWVLLHIKKDVDHYQLLDIRSEFADFFTYLEVSECKEICLSILEVKFKVQELPALLLYDLGPKRMEKFQDITDLSMDEIWNSVLDDSGQGGHMLKIEDMEQFIRSNFYKHLIPVICLVRSDDRLTRATIGSFQKMQKYNKSLVIGQFFDPDPVFVKQISTEGNLPLTIGILDIAEETGEYRKFTMDKQKTMKNYLRFFEIIHKWRIVNAGNHSEPLDGNNPEVFEKICIHSQQPCIIALVNRLRESRSKLDLEAFKNVMLRDLFLEFNWIWVDGSCHEELLQFFGLDFNDLTKIVYYSQSNKQFKVLKDDLNEQNLHNFLEDLADPNLKKKQMQSFTSQPAAYLKYVNCADRLAQLKKKQQEDAETNHSQRKNRQKDKNEL